MNLTIAQAAEQLAVSIKTISRRIASGELPAQYISSKCIRIDEKDLDAFKAQLKTRKPYAHKNA